MTYFVNEALFERNSSVEHAEFKRLKLFRDHGADAQIVVTRFSPNLARTLNVLGLEPDAAFSLYDFLAGIQPGMPEKKFLVSDLNLPIDYKVGSGNNYREVTMGDRLLAEIHFYGGTFGQVEHVDWYDPAGQLTMVQRYDIRGFKAAEEFYGTKAKEKYYQRYLRPDGTVFLESYFVESTSGTPIESRLTLHDFNGRDYYFEFPNDLASFALDALNKAQGGNQAFIADRPGSTASLLMGMKTKAKRYLWVATNHVENGTDPTSAPFLGIYDAPLAKQNLKKWDGIITATSSQLADMRAHLGKKAKLVAISPATEEVVPTATKVPRVPQLVMAAGRTGDDKGTPALIEAFRTVHAQLPDARLKIYGYGGDHAAYQDRIKAVGLEGIVELADYQLDLEDAYNQSQLFVDASAGDDMPLAMGEALAHGLPVVSYDYLYGPKQLLEDSFGTLVPVGDTAALAQAMIATLQAPDLAKRGQAAQEYAAAHLSGDTVWPAWQSLLGE